MSVALLHITHPDGRRQTVRATSMTVLGRGILPDRLVSKSHASVEPTAEGWLLRDLGSNNGTTVNGERVSQIALAEGDVIEIKPYRIEFRSEIAQTTAVQIVARDDTLVGVKASLDSNAGGAFPSAEHLDVVALRHRYEKLRVAHDISLELGLEPDPAALFRLIIAFCMKVFRAEIGVALMGEENWRVIAHRTDVDQAPLILSRTILSRVHSTRTGLLIEDAAIAFDGAKSVMDAGMRSILAVPVVTGSTTAAVLVLANKTRTNAFDAQDLEILTGIAAQAAVALERSRLTEQIAQEAATRAHLARFLSPTTMAKVSSGQIDVDLGRIARSPVVVLFSDIRGFTSFSERVGPEETVRMLNEHFEVMVDCVFRHGGVLDKFIGDSVMAIWGVPAAGPDDAERALACALDMIARLEMVNARRVAAGKVRVETGIGVHAGDAVVGAIGSSLRMEFTVIGDTVNLASRLCAEAGAQQVLTTRKTLAVAGTRFRGRLLAPMAVKGKAARVEVCVVLGYEAPARA